MYTHVLFDIDNTLLRSGEPLLETFKKVARDLLGVEPTQKMLVDAISLTTEDAMVACGFPDPKAAEDLWNHYNATDAYKVLPFDGILPLLDALKEKGISMGVVTSRFDREITLPEVQALLPWFSQVITADSVPAPKPAPDGLRLYMERTGARPEEILFLGDSKHDSGSAKAAGVAFGLALWGAMEPDEIEADYRFEHPGDVLKVV